MKNLFIDSNCIKFTHNHSQIFAIADYKSELLDLINNFSRKSKKYKGRGDVYKYNDLIIREYKHGGFFRKILNNKFFSEKRFFNELQIYLYLRKYNFPTLKPVGVIINSGFFFKKGFLITKEMKNVTELSKSSSNENAFYTSGVTAKLLHTLHIIHGDMHLKNFLIDAKNYSYLIDFDKSFFSEREDLKLSDIKRFLRSISKFNYFNNPKIPESCIDAFLNGYGKKVKFDQNYLNKISWFFNKPNF